MLFNNYSLYSLRKYNGLEIKKTNILTYKYFNETFIRIKKIFKMFQIRYLSTMELD